MELSYIQKQLFVLPSPFVIHLNLCVCVCAVNGVVNERVASGVGVAVELARTACSHWCASSVDGERVKCIRDAAMRRRR